ncbi:MAG: TolC family protein [Pseudomonadota bacterium]
MNSSVTAIGLLAAIVTTPAGALTLAEAEALALARDPAIAAEDARSGALSAAAEAAAYWPDPKLRFGAIAFPVDSFDRDQEPMTQLQLGVMQSFPRGNSLAHEQERLAAEAAAVGERSRGVANDRRRAVRLDWIDGVLARRVLELLERNRENLEVLVGLAEDDYATGRARQQDFFEATLELSRIEERIVAVEQAAAEATARLATWIGATANAVDNRAWPELATGNIELAGHPSVAVLDRAIAAAEARVGFAEEQYRPAFAVEVAYGDRTGQGPDGSARSDLVFGMVTMDVPLFGRKREDRKLAAAKLDAEGLRHDRSDQLRRLDAREREARAGLARIEARIALYEDRLLPAASDSRIAALEAFTASVSDLSDLLRAQVTEIELAAEAEQLHAERSRIAAELRWLGGY